MLDAPSDVMNDRREIGNRVQPMSRLPHLSPLELGQAGAQRAQLLKERAANRCARVSPEP